MHATVGLLLLALSGRNPPAHTHWALDMLRGRRVLCNGGHFVGTTRVLLI